MRIRVSKYNAEGYYSPTEYEGMKNLLREEYERKRAQPNRHSYQRFLSVPLFAEMFTKTF